MESIKLAQVYDVKSPYEKNTYLIDRLWPRGISKLRLTGAIWYKEVAPSNELRQWFHQNLDKWGEFEEKYYQELDENSTAWMPLYQLIKSGETVTLLYGSKERHHNQATVLRDFLIKKLQQL